jgi:hypothetical protein
MEGGITQGLLGFVVYLVAVPLLLRLRPGAEPATVVLAVALALWLVSLVALLAAGQRVNFWAFSISYSFLVLCFLMAFGAVYKSISLRVVAYLYRSPNHSASPQALERDILERSYQERLAILADRRYADRAEDRLTLTRSGERVASWAGCLQTAFRITRSG